MLKPAGLGSGVFSFPVFRQSQHGRVGMLEKSPVRRTQVIRTFGPRREPPVLGTTAPAVGQPFTFPAILGQVALVFTEAVLFFIALTHIQSSLL
jgi:hypothetical protein